MRTPLVLAGVIALGVGAALAAGAGDPRRDAILANYAAAAKAADPSFAGFSAERGRALYLGPTRAASRDQRLCRLPHLRSRGRRHVRTGRNIEPMAVSANPARFTDAKEVEKRFGRDCKNVLGCGCTPLEKGDFITFLAGR